MRNLKEIIEDTCKNINSNFLNFIKDIKNMKRLNVLVKMIVVEKVIKII